MPDEVLLPLWRAFIICGGRGGIGKTLLAMLMAVVLLKIDRRPRLLQADIQQRLEKLFPDLTTTISIDQIEALADDPLALVKAFSEIPRAARLCAAENRDLVVDTAATWHTQTIRYCAEARLPGKIAALGGKLTFLLPVTADVDSVVLAVDTALKIEQLLPSAELVFVLNDHPERVVIDLEAVKAQYGEAEIKRLLQVNRQIRLPKISQKIWGRFERANLSVIDVIATDVQTLTAIADADVDTTEVMQDRISAWLNAFSKEINPLLRFRESSENTDASPAPTQAQIPRSARRRT